MVSFFYAKSQTCSFIVNILNLSLIALVGTWLSCIKLKLENKGFVKNIEIDGGAVKNSLFVTYMWVQMGFPTGVFGVRSHWLT